VPAAAAGLQAWVLRLLPFVLRWLQRLLLLLPVLLVATL
jgi:hypothetical protein